MVAHFILEILAGRVVARQFPSARSARFAGRCYHLVAPDQIRVEVYRGLVGRGESELVRTFATRPERVAKNSSPTP